MQRFHGTARNAARRIGLLGAGLLAFLLPAAAHSRTLDTLQSYDPALETPAQADPALAAACRTSTRERLGGQSLTFERPAFSLRDGRQVVRMDLRAPGQPRDAGRIFRTVCVRDPAGAVVPTVFDGTADAIGPRVVIMAGPTPDMRPREAPTFEFSRNGPNRAPFDGGFFQDEVFGVGFSEFGAPCFGCPPFSGKHGFGKHGHKHKDFILGVPHDSPRFVVRKHGHKHKDFILGVPHQSPRFFVPKHPKAKFFGKTSPFVAGKPAFRPGGTFRFSFGKR